jgi:hypothetical protein
MHDSAVVRRFQLNIYHRYMFCFIGAPRFSPWGGGRWSWGYIWFMSDFKNYVMKIMSKSPSWQLVRLWGKLKLTKKAVSLYNSKFYLYFSILPCTSHHPIAVADLGWSVDHTKPLIRSCLQNLCSLNFTLGGRGGGGGCNPAAPPPSQVCQCSDYIPTGYTLLTF